MRLKKNLYAGVMFLAVASMVFPSVRANGNPSSSQGGRGTLQQVNKSDAYASKGNLKPARQDRGQSRALRAKTFLPDTAANIIKPHNFSGKAATIDPSVLEAAYNPQPVQLSAEMRARLNIRPSGAPTETAAARQARMTTKLAERKSGLSRGATTSNAVLPSQEIADGSALSAVGFVTLSGTEDFFDEAVLLGDLDGNLKMENDFDNNSPINALRTSVESQAKVEDDVLLPDEVYTGQAISGHNSANGFDSRADFNIFYTSTSAGFLNIIGDQVCDGDLFGDTVLGVVSAQNIVNPGDTFGRTFSNSAAITGLAVNTDSEYDDDVNSDEIVWFTIFDPEFGGGGTGATSTVSALCFMLDTDGDDIPDPAGVGVLSTSSEVAVAGVALDSFGNVYWQLTDFRIGRILKFWDVDEDRLPDVGPAVFNANPGVNTTQDLVEVTNAVDIAIDRFDSVYLQCSGGIGAPRQDSGIPNAVISFIDRCGDFDTVTGLIPRPDNFSDGTFRIFAASADVAQPAGAGTAPPTLVIPELQIDYAGAYRGLAADWDDNIYVAIGAVPAGQAGDPSPFTGSILRIPDGTCDRVGDSIDWNGDRTFGTVADYRWIDSPFNPPELTPNGINGVEFGPLYSLERVLVTGEGEGAVPGLGDDTGIHFAFDDFDGPANNVAGGTTDLLFNDECGGSAIPNNTAGGVVGFEFLFCNTAFTGFSLGSNGLIVFDESGVIDSTVTDNFPTVPDFLGADAPIIAPLWTDLNPGEDGQFSLHHLGFAATDAFIIQNINVPEFGRGGAKFGTDAFGFPTRGSVNSFDITFYDDQDAWDDVTAEEERNNTLQGGANSGPGDTTNLLQTVNDDNDGNSLPVGISLRPQDPTRLIDRNGDSDLTDENLAQFAQEGVGRTLPEQGPFKIVYHQIEVAGTGGNPVLVGFSTGADGVFNTGTVPPGLCETNLSAATPAADNPFFMGGEIGMGTEPSLYEYFNDGAYGSVNQDGTINAAVIDVDLRQEVDPACITRPERFTDTAFADCLKFKGSNIPVGLFCQSQAITAISGNTDPFLGPVNLRVNGFRFPMPTTGQNAICPQFCGSTAPLCRAGKSVTYDIIFKFDEDGDGVVDTTMTFSEPDVVVTSENQINLTIDFSTTTLCGGDVAVCVVATYGFGDDNKYFELQQLDNDQALEVAPVQLTCQSGLTIGPRAPVVTSIAPDTVNCDTPDDPDNVEDVQITGLCFFGNITGAFLATNPDGSGTRVNMQNVINNSDNQVTATIPLAQLTLRNTPYYVFVVRGDGVTSSGYPNAFGFDVTFTCTANPPNPGPTLANCKVVRVAGGKFVLQVNGSGFKANDTIVLINGAPCRTNKYPSKYINPSDNTTTRINCSGGLKSALGNGATITTRDTSNTSRVSTNSLTCGF